MTSDDRFPRLFEQQYASFTEDLFFWRKLAHQHGGPLLELGCGAGRVLLPLAAEGYEITGLDNSAGMLARAEANTPRELRSRIELQLGELTDFSLTRRFSLTLVPCNTFAELEDSQAVAALKCISAHLLSGGALALDMPNPPEAITQAPADDEPLLHFLDSEKDISVELYAKQSVSQDQKTIDVHWSYRILHPDGRVEPLTIDTQYHLRTGAEITHLLDAAGFAAPRFYGDYDFSDLTTYSPRLLVIAAIA